jgi:hypothetical protein
MHPLTREISVKRTSLDGEPRIIAHGGMISIVTPSGEIWHVLDSEGPDGVTHMSPRNDAGIWARIFIEAETEERTCIYRFGIGESRSTIAQRVFAQLERAKGDDARAVAIAS